MIFITAEFGAEITTRVFPFGCLSNGGFLGIYPLNYQNTTIKNRSGLEQTPLFGPFRGTNAPAARARRHSPHPCNHRFIFFKVKKKVKKNKKKV